MSLSAKTLWDSLATALDLTHEEAAARQLSLHLLAHRAGLSRTQILADAPLPDQSPALLKQLAHDVVRLCQHEPLQYVLGQAFFYDRTYKVSPHVLIPRPETEELVAHLVERYRDCPHLRILDVGTGSGCIAISLALHLPEAEVFGLDISPEALVLAAENAALHGAQLTWLEADVLAGPALPPDLHLIVSNPPYVREAEKAAMQPNVLRYEPPLALFVPDEEPLRFYAAIASQARHSLRAGGHVHFEINEALGDEARTCLEDAGFEGVQIGHDLSGKARFAHGCWPG